LSRSDDLQRRPHRLGRVDESDRCSLVVLGVIAGASWFFVHFPIPM